GSHGDYGSGRLGAAEVDCSLDGSRGSRVYMKILYEPLFNDRGLLGRVVGTAPGGHQDEGERCKLPHEGRVRGASELPGPKCFSMTRSSESLRFVTLMPCFAASALTKNSSLVICP